MTDETQPTEPLEPAVPTTEPEIVPVANDSASPLLFATKLFCALVLFLLFVGSVTVWYVAVKSNAPETFPVNQPILIEPGTNVKAITEQLEEAGVVKSAQLLYFTIVLMYDPADIKASTYVFGESLDTFGVAQKLTEGDFAADLVRFTHIEGESISDVAMRAELQFENFNRERFLVNAQTQEGFLFPETYFIPPTYTDIELLSLLTDTFQEKVEPLAELIAASPLTQEEVIILASIIEREANTPESMKVVSGILQNRLAIDMALQADATIEYVLDTPLGELPAGQLAAELRELDSPYNTYLYTGLPPTPIGNPGLDSIMAVLQPTESEYFYYITDDQGVFYYSETYDQHLRNIELHL